ncbi:hypothetical protein EZJ43_06905 [Pedobacter changchengzhani]|uniref:Uncharacterized protein n=1 Tax=Pedobacter changchengzhani TaxID=2529274 RepID=A0A4R5MMM4_9SPHI|nr:hypothetical protein [Pedobacter changchengzhani]TDG37000.1 hypothetical protein EZJ43_06905 [Pedobacter changchengzhani]
MLFAIKYPYSGCPFKKIEVTDSLIAIGHFFHLYLYDYINFRIVAIIEVPGFFSDILYHDNYFYVAGIDSVIKIDGNGNILWESTASIADDMILFTEIIGESLIGRGCFDPEIPNWLDFSININTGALIDGGNIGNEAMH